MDFFEPPPESPSDADERERTPPMPAWFGPPEGILPGAVALDRLIHRDGRAAMAFAGAQAYEEGCLFDLQTWVRLAGDEGEEEFERLEGALFRRPRRRAGGRMADEVARFGVQYSDGTKATTLHVPTHPDGRPPWEQPAPDHPVLLPQGTSVGGGTSDKYTQARHSLWLWPLPPAEEFDFVVEWPALGIPLTRVPLDGADIREAAAKSQPVWPDQAGGT